MSVAMQRPSPWTASEIAFSSSSPPSSRLGRESIMPALPLGRRGQQHLLDDLRAASSPSTRPRRSAGSSRACGSGPSRICRLLARLQRQPLVVDHDQRAVALDHRPLGREVRAARSGSFRGGCTARRRARSSSRAGTRGCSRPCGPCRCRGSTARAAGSWDPSGGACRGTSRRAPWPATSPRRGGPRRTRRRTCAVERLLQPLGLHDVVCTSCCRA